MLFQELDKIKRNAIMAAIVMMFVGLVLLLMPGASLATISMATGSALLIWCLYEVLVFLAGARSVAAFLKLVVGMIAGVVGLAVLIYPNFLVWTVSVLAGAAPLILGLYLLYHAVVYARRSGRRGWWVLAILSVLLIFFALFIFINPFPGSDVQLRVVGGSLLYSSLVSALSLIWLWSVRAPEEQ